MHTSDEDFRKYVRIVTVEEMITPGIHKQKLEALIPPYCPAPVTEFFNFLTDHVVLQSFGMGGVGLRESRESLATLCALRGWEYQLYSSFIEAYEGALLKSHYDRLEADKK